MPLDFAGRAEARFMTIYTEKPGQWMILQNVTWDYYSHTLDELGPSRNVRVTFDRGRMEIVTTSNLHERVKSMISALIRLYALERDIPITGDGSLTLRLESSQKGLEPDDCYYVQTPPPPASEEEFDLSIYPPPDLAIEIEVSRGILPKQAIYAALKVPEVWRYSDGKIVSLRLDAAGEYQAAEGSLAFPDLPMDVLSGFVKVGMEREQHEALKGMREWVRKSPGATR
jgi:Uma2 family endonuclease